MNDSATDFGGDDSQEYLEKASLRIVLSIDLAGSTAFKKFTEVGEESPWIVAFEKFYMAVPLELEKAYDTGIPQYCNREPYCSVARFKVLKTLGDEILFQVELRRHEEAIYHVHAAREAVRSINDRLSRNNRFLQCKPTAWLAGFPVVNSEIYMDHSDLSSPVDYIGPSMDAGFRLAQLSSPRRFIVSFDLAQMLAHALDGVGDSDRRPRLFYDGSETLPGVLGGIPYPIIWIDLFDSPPLEERLRGLERKPCNVHELWSFCEAFRERHSIWRWFIKGDPDPLYRGPDHPDYQGSRESWLARYRFIRAKRNQRVGWDLP